MITNQVLSFKGHFGHQLNFLSFSSLFLFFFFAIYIYMQKKEKEEKVKNKHVVGRQKQVESGVHVPGAWLCWLHVTQAVPPASARSGGPPLSATTRRWWSGATVTRHINLCIERYRPAGLASGPCACPKSQDSNYVLILFQSCSLSHPKTMQ